MKTLTITKAAVNDPPPVTGTFGQVLDKWMVDSGQNVFITDNLPARANGIPAVGQFRQPGAGYTPIVINKRVSDWWWKITKEVCPVGYPDSEITRTLISLTQWDRAFTNKTGLGMEDDPRNEYWTGDKLGQGCRRDIGMQYYYSAGATYKTIGSTRIAGDDCWVIEAMDVFDPATFTKTYKGNEHLFTIAANNVREPLAPHGFRRDPFPHLYNLSQDNYSRVLVPLLCNHAKELYIPKRYMRILPAGTSIPAYPYGWQ
jgi:hypothetical protein